MSQSLKNVIRQAEMLKELGVKGVFPSHAKLEEISTFIKENVKSNAPAT